MVVRYFEQPEFKVVVEASIPFGADGWTEPVEFHYRKEFNLTIGGLSGDASGRRTVRLQRSFNNGVTWSDMWNCDFSIERIVSNGEPGVLWRIGVLAKDDWGLPIAEPTYVRLGQ